MRRILAVTMTIAMLGATSGLLAACHTTEGAGQDISATGQAISKGASKLTP